MNKSVQLPSGAKLVITVSPFAVSRALYQALLEELKGLKLDPKAEIDVNLWKDLFCSALSSKKIEACLEECMKRATYNGRKIDSDTFEPVEARGDYFDVCFEVAKENVLPFAKSLYAQYADILAKVKSALA
jgi:hypothetical protein